MTGVFTTTTLAVIGWPFVASVSAPCTVPMGSGVSGAAGRAGEGLGVGLARQRRRAARPLESELAAWLGAPHLSLFNNGTVALIVACQALRVAGEVITSPFTFPATPHVLSWNNVTPVFAYIDPETMNITPATVEPLVTGATSAVLGVHVYGLPCDVLGIERLARTHGLRVIYDGAHAFGTTVGGEPIARFGDATMFSFHATKLFHTAEGGALAVREADLKARVDLLKNFG